MKRGAAYDLVAFFSPLALYLATMVPTIHLGDSGELTIGTFMLAVPHVPGYPLLAHLGHFFTQLPLAHVAWRGNFYSLFWGALAVWAVYRLLLAFTGNRLASLCAALAFAGTYTLWEQSLKIRVYPLNTLFTVLIIWFSLRWQKTFDRRYLLLVFFLLGLGMSNHEILMVVAMVPLALVFAHRREVHWRDLIMATTFLGLGLSLYLYLPIRAATEPILNWGEPNTLPRLIDVLLQRQYAHKMLNPDWGNKLSMLKLIAYSFLDEGGPLVLLLGISGLVLLGRRNKPLLVGLLLMVFLNVLLRINYIGEDEEFQVRRYLISSYLVLILGLGSALAALAERIAAHEKKARWQHAFLFLLVFVAAWPAVRHAQANQQSRNWVAYEAWQNTLSHPQQSYALFVGGDNNLFPLWYLQMVERRRPNIVVLPRAGFRADWVVRMNTPKLPPGTLTMRPEYDRPDLLDPLFLSTAGNLVEYRQFPFAFVFDRVSHRTDQQELHALSQKVHITKVGALNWWLPAEPADTIGQKSSVWRFYQLASITDTSLLRDHHTSIVATDYSVYLNRLAHWHADHYHLGAAQSAATLALSADPQNDAAMATMASLFAKNGEFEKAVDWYQKAIRANPAEWRHHHNLAIVYEYIGRTAEAEEEKQKAIRGKQP